MRIFDFGLWIVDFRSPTANHFPRPLVAALYLLLGLVLTAVPARAERKEPIPKELEEVGVVEHRNAQLPLKTAFVDSNGWSTRLGDYFDGTHPVILTLNYSDCPMLCSLQLNGLVDGLAKMPWDVGKQFRIVTISINPKESPERAQATKQKYLKLYGREGAEDSWHFLTSRDEGDIRKVANTVGFHYTFDRETNQYAHAAVLMICTPDGRVSRYLGGIDYDPQTLRLALLEASEGKVGTAWDQAIMFCFHYDATTGRYGPAAVKIMRAGGLLTLLTLGGAMFVLWRRGRKKSAAPAPG